MFLYGVFGALAGLALAGGGVLVGWVTHARHSPPSVDPLPTEERQRLAQEQKAFRLLQNYSVEDAYGLNRSSLHGKL